LLFYRLTDICETHHNLLHIVKN